MRLRLLRHAAADYHRFRGTATFADAPLSPAGEAQLPPLVARLRDDPPTDAYCSPTLRTMATASAIAAATGIRVHCWADLCEQGFLHGKPGLGRSQLAARFPLITVPETIAEGGWALGLQTAGDVPGSRRALRVLDLLLQRHPRESDDDVLLVTHLGFADVLVRTILGLGETVGFALDDAAITCLVLSATGAGVEYVNSNRHLPEGIRPAEPCR